MVCAFMQSLKASFQYNPGQLDKMSSFWDLHIERLMYINIITSLAGVCLEWSQVPC